MAEYKRIRHGGESDALRAIRTCRCRCNSDGIMFAARLDAERGRTEKLLRAIEALERGCTCGHDHRCGTCDRIVAAQKIAAAIRKGNQ